MTDVEQNSLTASNQTASHPTVPYREDDGLTSAFEATAFTLLTTGLGLAEHHRLLEVGCGSLQVGRLLMTFLRPERYHAFDRDADVVDEGIRVHCGRDLVRLKAPTFEHSAFFQHGLFRREFDFILAHWPEFPTSEKALRTFFQELIQCMHSASVWVTAMPKQDPQPDHGLSALIDLAAGQGLAIEFLQMSSTEALRWIVFRKHAAFGQLLRVPTPPERANSLQSTANQSTANQSASIQSAKGIGHRTQPAEENARRIEEEIARYAECIEVHNLPEIYHFWSNGFILPKLQSCGFTSVDDFFLQHMIRSCESDPTRIQQFISLGAGNCDLEVDLAVLLRDSGCENFHFTCLELNPIMVERGRKMAEDQNLDAHFSFLITDINSWQPEETYDICLANHSLHHFIELETIFAKVKRCIHPDGVFLANDMIGRNGHMRWPEALVELEKIWRDLPDKYKYNHQLKRLEHEFDNWDCSVEGNEGIRAQDILPLLLKDFHFEVFIGFANLIDIFVDRSFGHNYDPDREEDLAIIQEVAELDEALLDRGQLKPTHMLAAMRTTPIADPKHYKHWTADFCVRYPDEE